MVFGASYQVEVKKKILKQWGEKMMDRKKKDIIRSYLFAKNVTNGQD